MSQNKQFIGRWYIGFGLFLILCGLAGYASNPAAAKTALMSGGTFGTLLTTLMLCAAFSWRSVVSWQAFADGEPKLFAAVLITSMLIASVASIVQLFRSKSALLAKA